MTRILAIGEAMVELAPLSALGTFQMGFAGDTMNTAWYLRQLLPNAQIDFCSAVGTDEMSNQLVDFLDDAGIGTKHIFRRDDKTCGLYMISLVDGERSFSYWRSDSAARTLARDLDPLLAAMSGADVVYFSGISIAILSETDRANLLFALQTYRTGGGTVVFDPNLRPRLWADTNNMVSAIMNAAHVSDIVLPSFEDEADWFGDSDPTDTAKRYAAAGARCVIVKNGPDEMTALNDDKFSQHLPQKVDDVVDTTAAGDSFNAGFMAQRLTGGDVATSVDAGAALSAKVIGARGALVR